MAEERVDTEVALDMLDHLRGSGWLESRRTRRPIDGETKPLPWYTYSAIYFLTLRVQPNMRVFEFGSGNSTLWWAERVERVTAVEHHEGWATKMERLSPDNASVSHIPLEEDGDYCRAALRVQDEIDILVIDGRDRVNCARRSLEALRPNGVVIWDNTERRRYRPGYEHLAQQGFRRIEFRGLGPVNAVPWETSVFYRRDNCFDL